MSVECRPSFLHCARHYIRKNTVEQKQIENGNILGHFRGPTAFTGVLDKIHKKRDRWVDQERGGMNIVRNSQWRRRRIQMKLNEEKKIGIKIKSLRNVTGDDFF